MALRKEIETNYGVIGDYSKVVITNCNWLTKKAHIEVCLYTNEQARIDLKTPLKNMEFDLAFEQLGITVEDNIVAKTYEYLTTLPEFEGAEDC